MASIHPAELRLVSVRRLSLVVSAITTASLVRNQFSDPSALAIHVIPYTRLVMLAASAYRARPAFRVFFFTNASKRPVSGIKISEISFITFLLFASNISPRKSSASLRAAP